MYAKIDIRRIDDQKPTEVVANAGTPYRYKQVFGTDLLTMFANAEVKQDGKTLYDVSFLPELTYIMAGQAEHNDKMSKEGFCEWLEQFESFSFEEKAEETATATIAALSPQRLRGGVINLTFFLSQSF